MEIFLLVLRLSLAGVFFLAGIGKLLDLKGSEKAVKDFGVPKSLAKPFAILLPLAELSIAFLLLFVGVSWLGSIGASLLLLIFTSGMLWQMKKGNAPDCHCFGQISSEPVSKKSLLRNIGFAVAALTLVIAGKENQGLPISNLVSDFTNVMQIVFGLIIIGFLFILLLYLKNIMEKQTQILRRLEVIEIIANEGVDQNRENIGDPNEGLPIGSPVPDFELPNVNGRILSFDHLLMKGKPILIFNVSPTCDPCSALLPEIENWEKELADEVLFVFLSKGKPKENTAKFGDDSAREILLQDNKEIADLLEIRWTPTALFVNKSGLIASHPAAGDKAIRELIEKVKEENLDDEMVYVRSENGNGHNTKIGETIPEFNLEDLKGKKISAKDLKGKKTLVTFWSMTCPHCVEMSKELSEWDKVKGQDEPNLIVFSDGEVEDHESLELDSSIVLDKNYKTAVKFGMHGTPSAVLVDESGKIVSETAMGAVQIWALVGKKKRND